MYFIQKNINKFYQEGYTFFLNDKELNDLTKHFKKKDYLIYKPFNDAQKSIIYNKNIPPIILYEIDSPIPITHKDILGSLFSLQIDEHLFGDIVIFNNHYYFYTFTYLNTFFEMELKKIKNAYIELISKDIELLKNYTPKFEELTIINSSLRIDSIIAKIIHCNRDTIKKLIQDKNIIYNYELLKNGNKTINLNDTFSIRKYGKYRLKEIVSLTKKGNLVLKIEKYIDN